MAEELNVELRKTRGKGHTKRLRIGGRTPGVLYGHGQENVPLSVPTAGLDALVARGSRLVALCGAVDESAFIREVQWDTWGTHVTHVDFTRISADEKVQVTVAVELRGEAPGLREGGVIEHLIRELPVECPAGKIPERIRVSINELNLHDSITIGQMELPEETVVEGDTSRVVVQCVEPVEELDEDLAEAVPGEPTVIGAKEGDAAEDSK